MVRSETPRYPLDLVLFPTPGALEGIGAFADAAMNKGACTPGRGLLDAILCHGDTLRDSRIARIMRLPHRHYAWFGGVGSSRAFPGKGMDAAVPCLCAQSALLE